MATLRRVLVDEKGHPREAIRFAARWNHGTSAHHENLDDCREKTLFMRRANP